MSLLPVIGAAWVLLSLPVSVVVGRAIRAADRREATGELTTIPDFVLRSDLEARTTAVH